MPNKREMLHLYFFIVVLRKYGEFLVPSDMCIREIASRLLLDLRDQFEGIYTPEELTFFEYETGLYCDPDVSLAKLNILNEMMLVIY